MSEKSYKDKHKGQERYRSLLEVEKYQMAKEKREHAHEILTSKPYALEYAESLKKRKE